MKTKLSKQQRLKQAAYTSAHAHWAAEHFRQLCLQLKFKLSNLNYPFVYGKVHLYFVKQLNLFHYLRADWIESYQIELWLIDSGPYESKSNRFRKLATIPSPIIDYVSSQPWDSLLPCTYVQAPTNWSVVCQAISCNPRLVWTRNTWDVRGTVTSSTWRIQGSESSRSQ